MLRRYPLTAAQAPGSPAGGFAFSETRRRLQNSKLWKGYTSSMAKPLEVLGQENHRSGGGKNFAVFAVDDPNDGETKIAIVFDTPGYCAVLSLDSLIVEDISQKAHPQVKSYEEQLRRQSFVQDNAEES